MSRYEERICGGCLRRRKDAPGWLCDRCGWREPDVEVIVRFDDGQEAWVSLGRLLEALE